MFDLVRTVTWQPGGAAARQPSSEKHRRPQALGQRHRTPVMRVPSWETWAGLNAFKFSFIAVSVFVWSETPAFWCYWSSWSLGSFAVRSSCRRLHLAVFPVRLSRLGGVGFLESTEDTLLKRQQWLWCFVVSCWREGRLLVARFATAVASACASQASAGLVRCAAANAGQSPGAANLQLWHSQLQRRGS